MSHFARILTALALLLAAAGRPEDLPSPDAMWLGQRAIPRALVQGFCDGVEKDVLDRVMATRVAAAEQPSLRARAHTAMAPLLDEAFPAELLAGISAQFLSGHYTAGELRALRAHEESPLGRKVLEFDRAADELVAATPEVRAEARAALARRTFTDAERKELEAFASSPLGRKGLELGPALARTFLDQLDRRYSAVRPDLEPRLESVAEAVLMTAGGK